MLPILLLQLLPLLPTTVPVQEPPHVETSDHDHGHGDDFASMFEHRAYEELMRWKERHPWRVGTEVRKFALRYAETRAKGDIEVNRDWDMKAAFLAEVLADDVHTSWLITTMRFDVETRALFDTVQSALADIAASMPERKDATDASIIAEVGGLRPPIAPPWCFETCVEELTRIAEAARKTGHAEAANAIARETRTIAEKTHDGEIALWCATFLLRAEQEAGRKTEAEGEIGKLLAAARGVEHLPPGFTDALAEIEKGSGADSAIAVGIETLRADLAEREGKNEEALAHWNTAAAKSLPIRGGFHTQHPPLDALETALYGPDPVRRGALLAVRMGRSEEAWKLTRIAASDSNTLDPAAEKADRSRLLAASRLDALLLLVVDREKSLAAWSDAQGNRVVSIPAGLEKLRELVTELRIRGAGINEGTKPPSTPFDPSPAHLLSQVLLEPLGVPLRGRIGVCLSPELSEMPLGMLVVGEKFLVEQATIVRLTPGSGAWKVDEATSEAVTKRLQELGGKDDAVRTVQLEMIEGHGSLGSARKHPWYWAGLELGRP